MAKCTIRMSCGHEEIRDLTGKTSYREYRKEWFEKYGLCRECYKKKMAAEAEKIGLLFNAEVTGTIRGGKLMADVWFSGNTKPLKDAIKELGYSWTARITSPDGRSFSKPEMVWENTIFLKELEEEIKKAESLGAKIMVSMEELLSSRDYRYAIREQKKWAQEKAEEQGYKRPDVPKILKDHLWEEEVLGEPGNYTTILNKTKVSITDNEAEELIQFKRENDDYWNVVKSIIAEVS